MFFGTYDEVFKKPISHHINIDFEMFNSLWCRLS